MLIITVKKPDGELWGGFYGTVTQIMQECIENGDFSMNHVGNFAVFVVDNGDTTEYWLEEKKFKNVTWEIK